VRHPQIARLILANVLLSEERVRKGAEKLQKFLNTKQQGRLDGFFSVKPKDKSVAKTETRAKGAKRKVSIGFYVIRLELFTPLCRVMKKLKPVPAKR